MTEPTKEQIEKWQSDFEDDFRFTHGNRPMQWQGYLTAKKSDLEEIKTLKEQLEVERTKIKELTALIVNYMGMTEEEKEKYYETVLTFSRQEKIEHSVRKILNALDNQLNQELQKTREQLENACSKTNKTKGIL